MRRPTHHSRALTEPQPNNNANDAGTTEVTTAITTPTTVEDQLRAPQSKDAQSATTVSHNTHDNQSAIVTKRRNTEPKTTGRVFKPPPHAKDQQIAQIPTLESETHAKLIDNPQHQNHVFSYVTRVAKLLNINTEDSRNVITLLIHTHLREIYDESDDLTARLQLGESTFIDEAGAKTLHKLLNGKGGFTDTCGSATLWKFIYSFIIFNPNERTIRRNTKATPDSIPLQRTCEALIDCGISDASQDLACRMILQPLTYHTPSARVFQQLLLTHATNHNHSPAKAATWATAYAMRVVDLRHSTTQLRACIAHILRDLMYVDEAGFATRFAAYKTNNASTMFVIRETPTTESANKAYTPLTTHRRLRLQSLVAKLTADSNAATDSSNTDKNIRDIQQWKRTHRISPLLSADATRLAYFVQTQSHLIDERVRDTALAHAIHAAGTRQSIIATPQPHHEDMDNGLIMTFITQLRWTRQPFAELAAFTRHMHRFVPRKHTMSMGISDWLHAYIAAYQRGDPSNAAHPTAYCINKIIGFYSNGLAIQISQFTGANPINASAYETSLTNLAQSLAET